MVDEDEDVYAGDGMSSSEHVPAAAPSSTLFSDAPPPLDRTSNSAMVDPHTIDPFFEPLGTPARLNATSSLARSLSAWTDGTPTIRIVPDTPSGAEVQRTRHGLHDALVRAGCWSIPGGELVPSTMSRPSYPAGVADYPISQAHDPEQDEDDAEITTAEIAGLIAELAETRGLNKKLQGRIEWQQGRIEDLTRELEAVGVDTGYICHDCAALRDELRQTQHALDEAADLHARERIQRVQNGLELERLQVHCDRLAKLLDDSTHQLAAAQSAVAAKHVSRSAPPAVLSGVVREPTPLSPLRPRFALSSPDSAIPVPTRAASSYASPGFSVGGGSVTITSAADLHALIDQATLASVTPSEERSLIRRECLPGIDPNSRRVPWGASGDIPADGLLLPAPILTASKLHTVAIQPLELVVWRPGMQFFENAVL